MGILGKTVIWLCCPRTEEERTRVQLRRTAIVKHALTMLDQCINDEEGQPIALYESSVLVLDLHAGARECAIGTAVAVDVSRGRSHHARLLHSRVRHRERRPPSTEADGPRRTRASAQSTSTAVSWTTARTTARTARRALRCAMGPPRRLLSRSGAPHIRCSLSRSCAT